MSSRCAPLWSFDHKEAAAWSSPTYDVEELRSRKIGAPGTGQPYGAPILFENIVRLHGVDFQLCGVILAVIDPRDVHREGSNPPHPLCGRPARVGSRKLFQQRLEERIKVETVATSTTIAAPRISKRLAERKREAATGAPHRTASTCQSRAAVSRNGKAGGWSSIENERARHRSGSTTMAARKRPGTAGPNHNDRGAGRWNHGGQCDRATEHLAIERPHVRRTAPRIRTLSRYAPMAGFDVAVR